MKKKMIIIIVFIILISLVGIYYLGGMNISNSKKVEKEINTTTTSTITEKTTTTKEKLNTFKNKELSYWENKAREYYISVNKVDGIIVYSEVTKEGMTIYITLNDKILDVYTAKENTDFKNIKNELINL